MCRARPVIDILTWFGNRTVRINPSLAGCDMDPTSPEICFELGMGDETKTSQKHLFEQAWLSSTQTC